MSAGFRRAAPAGPVGDDEFAGLMALCGKWEAPLSFAVAVSGGPDSMALAALLHGWLAARGGALLALTVDHRLRPASAPEAEEAGQRLSRLGIPQLVLRWDHDAPPQSGIQKKARAARYALLTSACRERNIPFLFLAHHADDQAETLVMRMERSSGPDGLAGMPLCRAEDGVTLLRPLLPLRKARLEATCAARGIGFARDPSNGALRFMRARLRAWNAPRPDVERINALSLRAGLTRAHLEESCNQWLALFATADAFGGIRFDHKAWRELSGPLRARALDRALLSAGGNDYAPRGKARARLMEALMQNGPVQKTLGGCFITLHGGQITLHREAGLITHDAPLAAFVARLSRWDNRFSFSFPESLKNEELRVARLGGASRKLLEKMGAGPIAALPARPRAGLPALYRNAELFAFPDFVAGAPLLSKESVVTAGFFPKRPLQIMPFRPAAYPVPEEGLFDVA